jgi:hypothetical protein
MAGKTLGVEGKCKACGAAAPKSVLDRVSVPIVIRFGWLFFLVLPIVAYVGYCSVDNAIRRARYEAQEKKEEDERRRKEQEEEDRKNVLAACSDAYTKASAAKKACFSSLDDVERKISKDFSKEKPRAPSDVSLLKSSPVTVVGGAGVPDSPYFGPSPCVVDVPYDFEIDSKCYELYADGSVSAVRAQIKKTIEDTKAISAPDHWSTVTFACDDWKCTSTAYWIDAKAMKLLALARVSKQKVDGGASTSKDADKPTLAKMLGDAIAKWK